MMLADHARPVRYELPLPPQQVSDATKPKAAQLYIHAHRAAPAAASTIPPNDL
jgi:hypothetical protein